MGHENEVNQLAETVTTYSENPAMRHQLASLVKLLQEGGTPKEKQDATNIAEKYNLAPEDFDRVPTFWAKENLDRME